MTLYFLRIGGENRWTKELRMVHKSGNIGLEIEQESEGELKKEGWTGIIL
jgi:hypothetical protein